jgi:hypothetical protein
MAIISFNTISNRTVTIRVQDIITVQGGTQTSLVVLTNGDAYSVFGSVNEIRKLIKEAKSES